METPVITWMPSKHFVGFHLLMSLANDRTPELFQRFMPARKFIQNPVSTNIYEIIEYAPTMDMQQFSPSDSFVKWATWEVEASSKAEMGMEKIILEEGTYAVFIHRGTASEFRSTYDFIFSSWLPSSEYQLDKRPHFLVLGPKYKNNDPNSEEEIWIPIASKG
ncbi:MAG: GyrI-like domain-containing protein [Cytophagales bacterium]|nr:GyrI-like domain-containing protein [Cytophagales bacterium]